MRLSPVVVGLVLIAVSTSCVDGITNILEHTVESATANKPTNSIESDEEPRISNVAQIDELSVLNNLDNSNAAGSPQFPDALNPGNATAVDINDINISEDSCSQLFLAKNKCEFAKKHCTDEHLGYFNYLASYYCASSPIKAKLVLGLFFFWLACLFMSIGIAAYDFLCPNLNTMARLLGFSETLAGVTFLAFGNGSPDLFSTYAAMQVGSGSLAVGELLGAAVFITAAVTGAMALIKPFKVARATFVRDIGVFIVSISFALWFIADGVLHLWESIVMFALYVIYVAMVVGWHYYSAHRANNLRSNAIKSQNAEFQPFSSTSLDHHYSFVQEPGTSNPNHPIITYDSSPEIHVASGELDNPAYLETVDRETYGEVTRLMRDNRRHSIQPHYHRHDSSASINRLSLSIPPSPTSLAPPEIHTTSPSPTDEYTDYNYPSIRPSLVSAVEFSDALRRLERSRKKSEDRTDRTSLSLDGHMPSPLLNVVNVDDVADQDENVEQLFPFKQYAGNLLPNPDISLPNPAGARSPIMRTRHESPVSPTHSLYLLEDALAENTCHPQSFLSNVVETLFPSLCNMTEKSWYGALTSIVTAPFVLLLTASIPVFETTSAFEIPEQQQGRSRATSTASASNQLGISPGAPYMELNESVADEDLRIPRWLLHVQFASAPFLVYFAKTQGGPATMEWFMAAIPAGISVGLLLALHYFIPSDMPGWLANQRLKFVSFVGFAIAISWISVAANEVVAILKALGAIFHISDAILGLTVFAIGNSLGDLVADVTIARMGYPRMAFSACFGGPLLNILVGIGTSGMAVLLGASKPGKEKVYHIEISTSLVISGITLLIVSLFLFIAIPLNRWQMSRQLGCVTIGLWVISTLVNIAVEIASNS